LNLLLPYLFEYNVQNFVLSFNQKLRVRVIDANCSIVLEICRNYFGYDTVNVLLLMWFYRNWVRALVHAHTNAGQFGECTRTCDSVVLEICRNFFGYSKCIIANVVLSKLGACARACTYQCRTIW